MNFKPTLLKTVVSLLAGLIIYVYYAGRVHCDSPGGCINATWVEPLYFAIPVIIVIFVFWSLFWRKSKK